MYNNFAVNAYGDRLDGQEPFEEWAADIDLGPESALRRRLEITGIALNHDLGSEFLRAWESATGGALPRMTYPHRNVPIYDGQRIWWGRELTGYTFARGGGDGLPLPEDGEYIIPIFSTRGLVDVEDPQIEKVISRMDRSLSTERHENVRVWLEMPTGWRPEGAADVETSAEGAERPLQVGDTVRIRSDYPREEIPVQWRDAAPTFRARVEEIEGHQASLVPLVDRPDGFGRNAFQWDADAWERVYVGGAQVAEQVAEPTSGGRTAAEWEERWNTFWREGAERAQQRGYWRAFVELAEEFQVDVDTPYLVEGRLRVEVSPRLAGNSGRVTSSLISSILYEALRDRNTRMSELGREDQVLNLDGVAFYGMERVNE